MWSPFSTKAFRPATLLKRDSNTSVFPWNMQFFYEHLLWRLSTNGCFWNLQWQHQYFSMFINVHLNGSLWRAEKLHKKHWFYCLLLIELYNRRPATKFLKTFRTPFFRNSAQPKRKAVFRYTFTKNDPLILILVSICNKKGKLFKSYSNWVGQIYLKYPYELFLKI